MKKLKKNITNQIKSNTTVLHSDWSDVISIVCIYDSFRFRKKVRKKVIAEHQRQSDKTSPLSFIVYYNYYFKWTQPILTFRANILLRNDLLA